MKFTLTLALFAAFAALGGASVLKREQQAVETLAEGVEATEATQVIAPPEHHIHRTKALTFSIWLEGETPEDPTGYRQVRDEAERIAEAVMTPVERLAAITSLVNLADEVLPEGSVHSATHITHGPPPHPPHFPHHAIPLVFMLSIITFTFVKVRKMMIKRRKGAISLAENLKVDFAAHGAPEGVFVDGQ